MTEDVLAPNYDYWWKQIDKADSQGFIMWDELLEECKERQSQDCLTISDFNDEDDEEPFPVTLEWFE